MTERAHGRTDGNRSRAPRRAGQGTTTRRFRLVHAANDNRAPLSSRLGLLLILSGLVLAAATLAVVALGGAD